MKILNITDHLALDILIRRVLQKNSPTDISLETTKTPGETLRFLSNTKPFLILLDTDSVLSRDFILERELMLVQANGVTIIGLANLFDQNEFPNFPSNRVLKKSELTNLPNILIQVLSEGGFGNGAL